MNKKNADIAERQQRIEKLEKQLADMKQEMAKKKSKHFVKLKNNVLVYFVVLVANLKKSSRN